MVPESEIIFKISGSALSFLYYECDKSKTDQVGFLIGEKHSFVKKTISDAQMNGEKNETIINIVAVLPIGAPFLFCNNAGRVDKTKLKAILGSMEKDVCGWYIFRRNSGLNPLLRGTILHRELLDALPDAMSESFVLCCIGSDATQSRSTHRVRHVFLLFKNRGFESISVPVINLGQPEDIGYRSVAVTTSSNASFNDIASSIRLDTNVGGLAALKALQKPLQEKIMEIAAEVQKFDQKTQQLVDEIHELKYNNIVMKHNQQVAMGRKIQHGGGDGNHENNKFAEAEEEDDVHDEGVGEGGDVKHEEAEETGNIDGDSSEELVCNSQEVEDSQNLRRIRIPKKKDSLPTNTSIVSTNPETTVIDESNSPPNSHKVSSQEY